MHIIFQLLISSSLILFLGACGSATEPDTSNPDSPTSSTINVSYIKGPVTGASAILVDQDGNTVAGPVITSNGTASFSNVTYAGSVYAVFSGGTYTDEATDTLVTLAPIFKIRSGMVVTASGSLLHLTATPLTEIAFRRAETDGGGTANLEDVNTHLAAVADEYGLDGVDLTTVAPTPMPNINSTSDSDRYGTVLAAITQQNLNAGHSTPTDQTLANYIINSVTSVNTAAFTTAVSDLQTNINTSSYINSSVISSISRSIGIEPDKYFVSGNISGLSGSLVLQNNNVDSLTVSTTGAFIFPRSLVESSSYSITVISQPNGQTCTVNAGSGVISVTDITNVDVVCNDIAVPAHTVGGVISGLSGSVVLQNNDIDLLTVSANGTFTFPSAIVEGSNYAITILSQPNAQSCTINASSGVISSVSITHISIDCIDLLTTNTFDFDNDSIENNIDNCPTISNPDQLDSNANNVGDACDSPEVVVVEPEPVVELTVDNIPEQIINGYNVDIVTHANGAFVQLSTKEWIETGIGSSFGFREVGRDEWSVYLHDDGRDISIQLDLHRKKIIYSDSTQRFVLYTITSVSPEVINGYAASRVLYNNGGFVQINKNEWSENNEDGSFIFTETRRDEWSVYLEDANRGVQIKLDLFKNEIIYSDPAQQFVLYQITTASPDKINAYVMREVINDYAVFLQTDAYVWLETSNDGSEYVYTETLRDEWSSYLFDETRDAYIQLDLHTETINYHVGNDPFQPYQGVIPVANVESPEPKPLPSIGPIAWYTFDAGTTADASGNGNHLVTSGDVHQDIDGVNAEGLYLSGNNSSAKLPEGIVSELGDFTIATFVKLDNFGENSRVFDFGSNTSNYMYLTPSNAASSSIRFAINENGSGEQIINGTAPLLGGINGYNVQVVMHSTGAFVQLNSTDWVENSADAYFTFKEVNRDDWSVYLYDSSRDVSIQLDLHRNEVIYTDAQTNFVLYTITTVTPNKINGYAASRIRHSRGNFSQLSPTKWVEDNGVTSYTFTEVDRDEWSVYLYDAFRDISIQLDLFQNEIIYKDSNQEFVLYQITSTKPTENSNNWIHVAVTKVGNVATLYVNGAVVGTNINMTLSPSDLGITTQNWIGKSQFSTDPNLAGSIDDFRIYNRALSIKELRELIGPDPQKITIMGTDIELTPEEMKAELSDNGYTFVDAVDYSPTEGLAKSQCTILYASADREDISAEAGVLACSTETPSGDIKLTTKVIYGGCDVARLDQGVGSKCKVGLARDDLRLRVSENPAVYNDMSITGPEAEECTAISSENTCFGLGATAASASYGWRNENGSGLGVGAQIGVGAKASAGFSDGVLSGSINLKIGIGFTVSFSVSEQDVSNVYHLGESAWLESKGDIIAVGDKGIKAFEKFGNEVHQVGGQVVGEIEVAGETVVVIANDVGQTVEQTYKTVGSAVDSAANDVADGIEDTAGVVARGVNLATGETVTFVGSTVKDIGRFLGL